MRLILTTTLLLFVAQAFAQDYKITINGKSQKVDLNKKYTFITPRGDTLIYSLQKYGDGKDLAEETPRQPEKAPEPPSVEPPEAPQKPETQKPGKPATAELKKIPKPEQEDKPEKEKQEKKVVEKEAKMAKAAVEAEKKPEKKAEKNPFEFRKYVLPDGTLGPEQIAQMDTLKLKHSNLSVFEGMPSVNLASNNDLSFCYSYVIQEYHGYNEELQDKYTTNYQMCRLGEWSYGNRTARLTMTIKGDQKNIAYKIAQIDNENLVLVKR